VIERGATSPGDQKYDYRVSIKRGVCLPLACNVEIVDENEEACQIDFEKLCWRVMVLSKLLSSRAGSESDSEC
jgi:Fe-S cluster assembly iron-binding protein IscA